MIHWFSKIWTSPGLHSLHSLSIDGMMLQDPPRCILGQPGEPPQVVTVFARPEQRKPSPGWLRRPQKHVRILDVPWGKASDENNG